MVRMTVSKLYELRNEISKSLSFNTLIGADVYVSDGIGTHVLGMMGHIVAWASDGRSTYNLSIWNFTDSQDQNVYKELDHPIDLLGTNTLSFLLRDDDVEE